MSSACSLVGLFGALVLAQAGEEPLHRAPSIEVKTQVNTRQNVQLQENFLLYHQIHWGLNYRRPEKKEDRGDPDKDFSRLPTTYYHPRGPLGAGFAKFNWFPGPANSYHADARIAASIVGLGGQPMLQVSALWSEPPVAVLGLNIGTEAAYARPYQTIHFFERNPDLIALSDPAAGKTVYFDFITDAKQRGAEIKVFPGEHRATIDKHEGTRFYQLIVVETVKDGKHENLHEDLLTREAMQMLMSRLTEEGALFFHTSHRYIKVPPLIGRVAGECGYAAIVGRSRHDPNQTELGLFSSEWVAVARRPKYLDPLRKAQSIKEAEPVPVEWEQLNLDEARSVWQDGQKNSYAGLWRSDPFVADLQSWLRQGEYYLGRFGLDRKVTMPFVGPLHSSLRALDRVVVDMRNR
jgi:hypothetical protein